jgi:GxxExxY protein
VDKNGFGEGKIVAVWVKSSLCSYCCGLDLGMKEDLLFKEECYKIIGLCMKVHSTLGPGFKEIIYGDALEIELINAKIPYQREKPFPVNYDGAILQRRFVVDFLAFQSIVIEIKALPAIFYDHFTQTLNYLKASDIKLGIMVNFGANSLEFRRVVCSKQDVN